MNLTEFDRIVECMCGDFESIFTETDKNCDSYWEDKNNDYPCILEYMFDTPVEMMNLMNIYIKNEKLQRLLASDSYKRRTEVSPERLSNDGNKSSDTKLPEYVYVF